VTDEGLNVTTEDAVELWTTSVAMYSTAMTYGSIFEHLLLNPILLLMMRLITLVIMSNFNEEASLFRH